MDKYSVLYQTNIQLNVGKYVLKLSSSDIVSITFINQYDTLTFPIIRVRLYTDMTNIQYLTDEPDNIYINMMLNGGVYRMSDDNKTPSIVKGSQGIQTRMKVYIENKNIPSSKMDQYENGIRKSSDMNTSVKIPIELYCYDETTIHNMKQKTQSIYKDMSLTSIINDIFTRVNIENVSMDVLNNQEKFNQVLIPNLNVSDTLSYFDSVYGLYRKGAQIFGDLDHMYISDMDVNSNNCEILPIYVSSPKNNTDVSGLLKIGSDYRMGTLASNVSVMSESDIESVLNGDNITDTNINTLQTSTTPLDKLNINKKLNSIDVPSIIHKTKNEHLSEMSSARINERITRVDISGVGYDITKMKINTRYNVIFENPLRGNQINERYRASYVCHVLTNMDSDKFIAQTTMNLCSN